MRKINFNHNWQFRTGDGSSLSALLQGGSRPQTVDLPHDAEILRERNPDEPDGSGNGFFHAENYCYTKSFRLDPSDAGKMVYCEFEGVYENAFVYVNNAFAGKHPYGYGNFYLNLTDFIRFDKDNQIKVIVKNGVPSGRWYTGGGIYRDVNLMIADRTHIKADGVQLMTSDLDDAYARVRIETGIENKDCGVRSLVLRSQILDADGTIVAEDSMPVTLREGADGTYRQWVMISSPCAWSPETPYLYSYRVCLLDGDNVLDEEDGTFGVRTIQVDPVRGLRINGKMTKLRGGCLHHDAGITGAAEFAHAQEVRVKKLKEAGFNALRSSHYPMSRKLLEACDRQGMFVMDEFSDVWTTTKVAFDYGMFMSEWWETDVNNMVRKDYNHPSVILYSIGNEIPETGNRIDVQWGKKIADRIRALDDSRFLVNSMNLMLSMMDRIPQIMAGAAAPGDEPAAASSGQSGTVVSKAPTSKSMDTGSDNGAPLEINSLMNNAADMISQLANSDLAGEVTAEAAGQVDIVGYNYAAGRYEKDHLRYPNRVMMGSETSPKDLDINWGLVEKLPFVVGDFDWTAYDYLGESGIGKVTYGNQKKESGFYSGYPTRAAYCGDINLIGDFRPSAYWRKIIWGLRHKPYIAVQPPKYYGQDVHKTQWTLTDAVRSWTFDEEQMPVNVEVYSDAEEVELFVNGVSWGRKKVGEIKKDIVYFDTIYEKGTIRAVNYRNGYAAETDEIRTAAGMIHIQAVPDRAFVPADRSDITYIDISLVDENGVINTAANMEISVSIEGNGIIQGFGSADPESTENFFDQTARTFEGRLKAAVRGNGVPGDILISFSGTGLDPVTVSVKAV